MSEMTREHLNALVVADLALQERAAHARSLDCHAVAERAQHARERLAELAAMIEAKLESRDAAL